MIYRLYDLHDGTSHARNSVMRLAFSPDDHFLAGSDNAPSAKLCVWDMPSGSVAAAQKQKTLSFVTWGPVAASERKVSCTRPVTCNTVRGGTDTGCARALDWRWRCVFVYSWRTARQAQAALMVSD